MTDFALEFRQVAGHSALGKIGFDQPITFGLKAGEIGVILGGKETSSLFRLAIGMGTIDKGEVEILGQHRLKGTPDPNQLTVLRQKIGFGFREKGLINNLTLKENVDLPAKYHGFYHMMVPPGSYAEKALAELNVDPHIWGYRPSRVSWEVRKRVLLARAIVLDPPVLILDDPTAQIATPALPWVMHWIDMQRRLGRAILLGTNDYPVGIALASWVLHPKTQEKVATYDDFIEPTWIRSAELLAARMAAS